MYSQCSAYATACDKMLEVKVLGDAQEARRFQEMEKKDTNEDDEDGGKDESQEADVDGDKSRRVKVKTVQDKSMKMHPLRVELKVKVDSETCVTVTSSWCLTLNIVSAEVTVSAPVSGDLVTPDSLLSHLTPADTGDKSPNPSSSWQLSQLGITDSLSKLLPGKLFYHWVQRLAGLDFLETKQQKESETAVVEARPEVSQLYMETTINNIRSRLETRISLHKQVESLTNHKIDSASVSGESKLPTRAVSRLKSWQSVDWETYSQHEFTQHLVTSELVHQHCHLYKCTVIRDKAIMTGNTHF